MLGEEHTRTPAALRRLGAVLLGVLGALGASELALRMFGPAELGPDAPRQENTRDALERDEVLGLRPVLGGPVYGEHGALRNEYALAKPPGKRRLLFLGDSATRRGEVVAGLQAEIGADCECWNAGVEGWSTWQEQEYYRRYLGPIEADHVVLTFHLNDYLTTPVTSRSRKGGVVTVRGAQSSEPIGWLWELSHFYRFTHSFMSARPDPAQESTAVARLRIERALADLRGLAHERGAELSVLVLPWLRPRSQWPGSLPGKHAHVVGVLERLGIRHYTFLAELDQALLEGEEVSGKPGDPQHPSAAFGRRMARAMLARGFVP